MKTLLLVAAGLLVGTNSAWADDWSTVWSANFSSAPSGMTYSVTSGSTNIDNGYLSYHQGGGSGDRAINTAFTDAAFSVDTNWKMEFDWNSSSANANSSNVTFATNNGNAFTLTWASYATVVVVTDATGKQLSNTLPILGYNKGTCGSWSHITITGDTENGIYLTITNGETTYVNNELVTSTFGYPSTFNGSLGRAVSHMYIDNIDFATPKVAGYVAPPTGTIKAPDGTSRKFTLSCLTENTKIYYAESDIEIGADGWKEYPGNAVTTAATTIYAYASDGNYNSEKISFATGAGTAITLNAPTISLSGISQNGYFYYPQVTIASNQNNLDIVPESTTLNYSFNGASITASSPYTFTGKGTLTVTVEAEGFTSNSASYDVSNEYVKTKTIDLATITANDLSAVWTKSSDAAKLPHDNWKANISSNDFPLYIYNYTSDDAASTDVIDGLTFGISSKDADPGVTPTLYVGAGIILPTKKLNASDLKESGTWNSNINVGINGGTAEQIATYTYPTNYGSSTSTKTIAANENFGLYRYSDMLTKVELYSPASEVEIAIANCKTYETSADFATYIDGGTYASAAEVYAAHTAWQVENGTPSKAILNNTVTSADHWWGTLTEGANYEGAPDTKYLANAGEYNVNQIVYGLPAGTYKASAWTYSSIKGYRKIYVSKVPTSGSWEDLISPSTETQGWVELSGEFTLTEPSNVAFGLYGGAINNRSIGFDNWTLTQIVPATVTAAGWATLYTDKALDFSGVEGLEAYTATLSESTVTLKKVDNVPAGTGVVLKATETLSENKTYSIPVIASSETPQGSLKGSTTEAKTATPESPIYILKLNNNNEAQFMRATSGSLAAGKAYLNGGQEAKALTVVFANDPTGIANVNAAETVQPVKRIVNGQLVIEKNGKRYNAAGAEF